MQKELEIFLEKECGASRADRILVAVSGGLDSMTLLHLLEKACWPLVVAHANFQLRGAESDGDEEFVRSYCLHRSIAFVSKRFDTKNDATDQGRSIQMVARDLRYEWFQEIAREHRCQYIATAHHRTDFAETVVMGVVRGKGAESMLGIPAKNGNIIRPLLYVSRAEIEHYATREQLVWREDASNAGDSYHRNKIRHWVMPVLTEVNPSVEKTLYEGAYRARLEQSMVQSVYAAWRAKYFHETDDVIRISKEALADEHSVLLLFRALQPLAFNFDQCRDLWRARSEQPGRIFASPSHEAVVDREFVWVASIPEKFETRAIDAGDSSRQSGRHTLLLERVAAGELDADPFVALMDAEAVVFPLTWRAWREGDSFIPLGMEHHKKISDYLIDRKISRLEKQRITVLESEGRIIWLVGQRIDQRVRLLPHTQSVLRIRYTQQ